MPNLAHKGTSVDIFSQQCLLGAPHLSPKRVPRIPLYLHHPPDVIWRSRQLCRLVWGLLAPSARLNLSLLHLFCLYYTYFKIKCGWNCYEKNVAAGKNTRIVCYAVCGIQMVHTNTIFASPFSVPHNWVKWLPRNGQNSKVPANIQCWLLLGALLLLLGCCLDVG